MSSTLKSPDILQTLQEQLAQSDTDSQPSRQIPPLEKWVPKNINTMDMVIKANGEWWHEGAKVTRQSLVDLFSKVLWAEIDDNNQVTYYLKTPVEKLRILVEDAPLLVTQVDIIEKAGKSWIQLTTAQGDTVVVDEQHPMRFGLPFNLANQIADYSAPQNDQPYILVRQNGDSALYALIHRNVFYHLVEMGELIDNGNDTVLRLTSGGQTVSVSMSNSLH